MSASLEYARLLQERTSAFAAASTLSRRIGNARLAVVLVAVVIGYFCFGIVAISIWWLLPVLLVFLLLMIWHGRVWKQRTRAARAMQFYEGRIARLNGTWAGTGNVGERFRDPAHPYAEDLDLFGKGSLFDLLCSARTAAGEAALAGWLRYPAAPATIRARQEAVAELRDSLALREDLAVLGEELRQGIREGALERWGAEPALAAPKGSRAAAGLLAAAFAICAIGYLASWWNGIPALILLLLELALALRLRPAVLHVLQNMGEPVRELPLLSEVLQRLEKERFKCALLRELRGALDTEGVPASARIRRLGQLVALLDSRRNQIFAIPAAALMWGTQFTLAIEAWRQHSGVRTGQWLRAVGEMEALSSLAAHHYEHPENPFPEIVEDGPLFDADSLRHPLLLPSVAVPNDVLLNREIQLLLVSGSNMAGKSTLLRSIGLNVVLALAGGSVCAVRLHLSPLAIGASISTHDSLLDGRSRFYAEITRLRQIVELTRDPLPPLFLIDEMLSGTNSHDRRIGAEGIIRGLIQRGAIGLVTTHDLALAQIASDLERHARNVHFADTLEDGQLHFDYRLHPGVVQRSNALELMRSVGLEV